MNLLQLPPTKPEVTHARSLSALKDRKKSFILFFQEAIICVGASDFRGCPD